MPPGRFAGPQQAAQASRQRSILLLLAGSIFLVNLYLYVAPRNKEPVDVHHGARAAEVFRASEDVLAKLPRERQEERPGASQEEKPGTGAKLGAKGKKQQARQTRRDSKKKKNVLFIMTDDLRPSLSIYDKPVITPGFERLAQMGVVFERAYNQDPICNPSRNSMLSGRRPDSTRVWLFEHTVPHEYSNIFKVSPRSDASPDWPTTSVTYDCLARARPSGRR
jgi:hypothetical protein